MKIRIISRDEIVSLITMEDAIDAMRKAFGAMCAGRVEMPVRVGLGGGRGTTLFMPARLGPEQSGPAQPGAQGKYGSPGAGRGGDEEGMEGLATAGERGAKIVSIFPENRSRGLPSISGVVLMLDDETGMPTALMDAGELTAIRTAAAAGLAAKLLSRPDSRVLTIFGAGAQAPRQIEAMRAVRPIEEVRVVSRGGESARRLAASLQGVEARAITDPARAVEGADIIAAVTTSRTPVCDGTGLPPGTHISGSGSFMPDHREIGAEIVARARVVVEDRAAVMEEAGDLIIPIAEGLVPPDPIDAELGEIVNGTAPEGNAGRELTFFKSVGVAVQDVAIGAEVARRAGVGG